MRNIIYYVYAITNTLNSKIYIGQTKSPKNRKGRKMSEEQKRKISESMKLYKKTKKEEN